MEDIKMRFKSDCYMINSYFWTNISNSHLTFKSVTFGDLILSRDTIDHLY